MNGVTLDRFQAIKKLKQKHTAVLQNELGILKGAKARLTLNVVVPKTTKPYKVPLAMGSFSGLIWMI